jgi:hypothetical protein
MTRALALLAAAAAMACGQTSRDNGNAGGGGTGAAGSGGTAGAIAIECAGKHWTRLAPPPGATVRHGHPAVAWRSDQILIWGGGSNGPGSRLGTGWRVFSDGSVHALPVAGAPQPRSAHALDVIDDRLVVWGGDGVGEKLDDGGWLALNTDEWSPLSNAGGLLGPRHTPLSGVVGGRWLVWSGYGDDGPETDGAFWHPDGNSWSAVIDAPSAAWIGEPPALARGGPKVGPAVFVGSLGGTPNLGYGFDPNSESWWTMPSEGAPSPRTSASLTWSRVTSEFIVWGGAGGKVLGDGARYSLAGIWKPMSNANAPGPRWGHLAVMLGAKLVVFGGSASLEDLANGGIYDTATDTWEPLPLDECAPEPLAFASFTAFGDGKSALLWGGFTPDLAVEQGWLFKL